MSDQPTKNIAFELLLTNQSLEAIGLILLALTTPGSEAESILTQQLDSIRSRIQRLNYLRK
jgi:hypothetical protein